MDEQLKSPCIGCDLENEDKNNPECMKCDKRCRYVNAMGNMSSSLPDDHMEAIATGKESQIEDAAVDEKIKCNVCCNKKASAEFDMVNDGSRKRKTCRVCQARHFEHRDRSKPKDSTMEKEIIYLFAPFPDSKILQEGKYPTFQAYTGDEFNAVLRNGDLGCAGEVLEVELICRHKIKETVTYSLED